MKVYEAKEIARKWVNEVGSQEPAFLGAFFAESLIMAETGNSIGAIQIAGTAMPAQLPFFVAACDYTLIGEELFAASAYLSREPKLLGSLKGQDVGKFFVLFFAILGSIVLLATFWALDRPRAAIVNVISGAVLVAVGVGMGMIAKRLTARL